MLIPVLVFSLGLLLLINGGDWFVEGATGIAQRFGVPELLIGATVVSIGTTLPEVMVSATSALQGHGEIAYGNAIGSVICNTALIAALTIAIKPSKVERSSFITPVAFFFVAAAVYCYTAYSAGAFTRQTGFGLLGIFALYLIVLIRQALRAPRVFAEGQKPQRSMGKDLLLLAVGAVFIAGGANLLVDNGILIARALGVPESVVALTFVALGTSLPELVTAVTALLKGHGALSLGNIIGANLFNLVFVSGVSVVLSPFALPVEKTVWGRNASLVVDIPVMLLVMALMTLPTLVRGKLSRWQGVALLGVYVGFCLFQFLV